MINKNVNTFVLKESNGNHSYPLSLQHSLILGRETGCDIEIDEKQYGGVSRHHAEIRPIGKGWQICDLKSANGTYVNQQRINGCQQLCIGDRIQLDQYGPTFVFEPQAAHPSTPVVNHQGVARTLYNPNAQNNPSVGVPSLLDRIPWKVVGGVVVAVAVLFFVTRPQPTSPPQSNPSPIPLNSSPATSTVPVFANGLFSLQLPAKAKASEDNSKPGKSVDLSWTSDTIPYLNVTIQAGTTNPVSADKLARVLQDQIREWFGKKNNFDLDQPTTLSDGSARIFFRFDNDAGRRIGVARMVQRGDKVGIVIVVFPQPQHEQLSQQVIDIINSFDINPTLQVP
jgi:pSer/pThr/pTyr-binding forkhead associated (FHA) protein